MKNIKSFESYTILGRTETVKISNSEGQSVIKIAKIDTGSYSSRISSDIAKELNLPVVDQKEIKSATGEEDRTFVEVQLNINDIEIKTTVGIADMDDLRNEIAIGRKDIEMLDGLVDVKKEAEKDIVEEPVQDIVIEEPIEEPVQDIVIEDPTTEIPPELTNIMTYESFTQNWEDVNEFVNNNITEIQQKATKI